MTSLLTLPQAVALLLGVWAIVLLANRWRAPRERVRVPSLQLWDAVLTATQSLRWHRRTWPLVSLLIALTTAASMIAALTAPTTAASNPRSLLLLIDAGQSMQATDATTSRLEVAQQRALQLIVDKPAAELWQVAQLDTRVHVLCAPTRDPNALSRAVRLVAPTDATTDFAAARSGVHELLSDRPNPYVILLSDGVFEPGPPLEAGIAWQHDRIGSEHRNVGIRSMSARRYASNRSQSEVLVELENAGDQPERVELTLLADGAPILVSQLQLDAHAVLRRVYAELPTQRAERLEARATLADGQLDVLAADDRAYAVLPSQSPVKVLLVSDGDRYLEAGLLADDALQVELLTPAHYRDATGYDVAIFDGYAPERAPNAPSFFIAPKNPPSYLFASRGEVKRPSFSKLAGQHPLLERVAVRDVNIARAALLTPRTGDTVVAATEDRTPLIITGVRAGQPFVALSFDVRESDLPLRVAWPLLLHNVLAYLHPGQADYRLSLRAGVAQSIAVANAVDLVGPDGSAQALRADHDVTMPRAGFYSLRDAAGKLQPIAANRDPQRSVTVAPRQLAGASPPGRSVTRAVMPQVALLLAWLLVCVDWLVVERRRKR